MTHNTDKQKKYVFPDFYKPIFIMCFAAMLMSGFFQANAQSNSWVDKNGVRHFSDNAQPKHQTEKTPNSRQPTQAASVSGQDKIVNKQGPFVLYASGIVRDTRTSLEWFAGPDQDTTWDEAKAWVQNLTVGHGKWRMPMMHELQTLYWPGVGTQNMSTLFINTNGNHLWSGEEDQPNFPKSLDFRGAYDGFFPKSVSSFRRGFAVRKAR